MTKGILLAGGRGTRLLPMTRVVNKHLLPCYDRPLVYYPLETLLKAGCKDILIITSDEHAGDFISLLGDGQDWGAKFTYKVQTKPSGIAGALALAEEFVEDDCCLVILGDNYYDSDLILPSLPSKLTEVNLCAKVWLKEVPDPERFGVAEVDEESNVISIIEKPEEPRSNYAVTGAYFYPSDVFDKIKDIEPSDRGELEVTDINNMYLEEGRLKADILEGHWSDMGTVESLFATSIHARQHTNNWRKL